jgi:membrane protease YdiL (CAAX protease family)
MSAARHTPLLLIGLYVVAVTVVISGRDAALPDPVIHSLNLRQLAFLSRYTPPPDQARPPAEATADDSSNPAGDIRSTLVSLLEEAAPKRLASDDDHLRGALAALAVDARHLVPIFLSPLLSRSQTAEFLTLWSLDPTTPVTPTALDAVKRDSPDPVLANIAVATLARAGGLQFEADRAHAEWLAHWRSSLATASALVLAGLSILIVGAILIFRMRRMQIAAIGKELPPMDRHAGLPLLRVFVYFLAVYLTSGVLSVPLLAALGWTPPLPVLLLGLYLCNGIVALWLVGRVGREHPMEHWVDLTGFSSMLDVKQLPAALGWGLAGYCLLWPAVLSATFLNTLLFGAGGEPFDNPVALLLVSDQGTGGVVILGLMVAVLAPAIEEPLFRGYLYGRLRRHLTPYGAAALSGLGFAAVHLSAENFLPLWAIGFSLALLYERTRNLAAPMLAHGLWNLITAASLMTVFG